MPETKGSVAVTVAVGCVAAAVAIGAVLHRKLSETLEQKKQSATTTPRLDGSQDSSKQSPTGMASSPPSSGTQSSFEQSQKVFYQRYAELHCQRSGPNAEWADDELGIRIPFSSTALRVLREERQHPIVMITFGCGWDSTSTIQVIVEECPHAMTDEQYRAVSIEKVAELVNPEASSRVRMGMNVFPQAEYSYIAEDTNTPMYVTAVFLSHGAYGITVQYISAKPWAKTLPSAFHEMVRTTKLSTDQKPSQSHLFCTEPRKGLGFRLPLGFMLKSQRMEAEGDLQHDTDLDEGDGHDDDLILEDGEDDDEDEQGSSSDFLHGNATTVAEPAPGVWVTTTTFAALTNPSTGLSIAARYEQVTHTQSVSQSSKSTSREALWPIVLDHVATSTFERFAIQGIPTISFEHSAGSPSSSSIGSSRVHLVARACSLAVPNADEQGFGEENASSSVPARRVSGYFWCHEVFVDAQQSADPAFTTRSVADSPTEMQPGRFVPAIVATYVVALVPGEYLTFAFVAPRRTYDLRSFVLLCNRTMDSITLGNHYGQTTSLRYYCRRHMQPFFVRVRRHLMVTEPRLGDPLCRLFAIGRRRLPSSFASVTVRMFPCPLDLTRSAGSCESFDVLLRTWIEQVGGVLRDSSHTTPSSATMIYSYLYEYSSSASRPPSAVSIGATTDDAFASDPSMIIGGGEISLQNPFMWVDEASLVTHTSNPPHTQSLDSVLVEEGEPYFTGGGTMRASKVYCHQGVAILFQASSPGYSFPLLERIVNDFSLCQS